jgi:hypothetical protein
VRSYKRLSQVEQAFRCLKGIDPGPAHTNVLIQ